MSPMAMNFIREIIDGLSVSHNLSNSDLNRVSGSGLVGSNYQRPLSSNAAIGFHQNDLISQMNQPSMGLGGQLGLGQRVTEVRQTYVTPNRVQVDSFINYFPVQNQLAFPPNEVVGISEVTKTTRFLTPTSTLERLLDPNYSPGTQIISQRNSARIQGLVANDSSAYVQGLIANDSLLIQGQPNFGNQISSNQLVNHPFTGVKPFLNPFHQNRSLNQRTPRIMDLDDRAQANGNGVLAPKQLSAYASLAKGNDPVLHRDQNPMQNSILNSGECSSRNQDPSRIPSQANQNRQYDGRTHSLPCKKYGPYKCPKCQVSFEISQSFAAHMWSHYKYETSTERKRRLAARSKKRLPCLSQSNGRLTINGPQPSSKRRKVYTRNGNGRGERKTEVKFEDEVQEQGKEVYTRNGNGRGEMKIEVQEQEKEAHSAIAKSSNGNPKKIEDNVAGSSRGEVKIKKEPM